MSQKSALQRRLRRAAPASRQGRPQDARPLFDLAAHEELIRPGLLEGQARVGARRAGRLEVDGRRLRAATGQGEGLRQPHAHPEGLGRPGGQRVERELIEIRGAIERELLDRLRRGALRVGGRPRGLLRVEPVPDDGLGVDHGLRLVRPGEPAMVSAEGFGRELRHDGLPDPIVRRLHRLAAVAHHQAQEATRPQIAEAGIDVVARARGVPQDRRRHRPPVGRDQLEEVACVPVEARHAPLDDLLQGGPCVEDERVGVRRQPLGAHASSEVFDEERAPSRTARDGVGHALRGLVVGAHQIEREPPRVFEPERVHRDGPYVGAVEALLDELLQERAGRGLRALPLAQDEQEPRGAGGSHDLEEQGRAVDVAPLDVVEVQDRRTESRQLREERSQRRERSLPHALRVVDRPGGQRRNRVHPPEHRKQARERPHVGRQGNGHAPLLEGHQASAERVDHAVDGLVRD